MEALLILLYFGGGRYIQVLQPNNYSDSLQLKLEDE